MHMFRSNKNTHDSGFLAKATVIFCLIAVSHGTACAQFQYDPHGRRDPFVPLVGVGSRAGGSGDLASVLSVDDISLQGILESGDGVRCAIMNGEIVLEGQSLGNVTIESVRRNSVMVRIGDETYEVKLYE